jgi:ssDNA-binding replication factor A large subunit
MSQVFISHKMVSGNFEVMIGKIAERAGIEKEEVQRRIDAKRAKLSDLISKEGAAQIVAAELGISFDNERLKIEELLPGMKKVNTVGKVLSLSPVREFVRNNKPGKVCNMLVADSTSNVKIVLWDTNHIELIEKRQVSEGSVVEVSNASMRDNELHLGSFSEFKLSDEKFDSVETEIRLQQKKISDLRAGDNVKTRAFIVQSFSPRFFDSKQKPGERGSVMNIVIDDGTESIRGVLFGEDIGKLGLDISLREDMVNDFNEKRGELLGKEMFFSGSVRKNKLFENLEFSINDIMEVKVDELIKELEAN